jgi:hypothetical protein
MFPAVAAFYFCDVRCQSNETHNSVTGNIYVLSFAVFELDKFHFEDIIVFVSSDVMTPLATIQSENQGFVS